MREKDGITILPVVEERLAVEKRLVLAEEIQLHRARSTEEFAQSVTLASERAEIERDTSGGGQN